MIIISMLLKLGWFLIMINFFIKVKAFFKKAFKVFFKVLYYLVFFWKFVILAIDYFKNLKR